MQQKNVSNSGFPLRIDTREETVVSRVLETISKVFKKNQFADQNNDK